MKKAAVYLRMSTKDGDRPQLQALLRDAAKGLFDVVVVDESSRLSRQKPLEFMAKVAWPLKEAGVDIDNVSEGRRSPDALVDMLLMTVGQDRNSEFSVTLGRNTATGQLRKAKEGKLFVGRPPYGYHYVIENNTRIGYTPGDQETVRVVQFIYDAYGNRDLSVRAIVAQLNERRLRSPSGQSRWAKSTVRRILINRVYAGDYVFGKVLQGKFFRCKNGEIVRTDRADGESALAPRSQWLILPDTHEPLVVRELFERVQELLAANRSRTSSSRMRAVLPLSRLLVCGNCGARMSGATINSGGVKHRAYRCFGETNGCTSGSRQVRESMVLPKVIQALQEAFLLPENRERLSAEVIRQAAEQESNAHEEVRHLEQVVARLDKQINKAKENILLLDSDEVQEANARLRGWKKERDDAQAELERHRDLSPTTSFENIVKHVERLVEVMAAADPALMRAALREIIDRVELQFDRIPKKKVTRYPLTGGVVHLRECANLDRSETGLICTSRCRRCRSSSCPRVPTAPPARRCATRCAKRGRCSATGSARARTA
jgi:DNA invertase Pin-like site-specific DNA recombinase